MYNNNNNKKKVRIRVKMGMIMAHGKRVANLFNCKNDNIDVIKKITLNEVDDEQVLMRVNNSEISFNESLVTNYHNIIK